jgi:DNA mismatch repair protein MutS2
MLISQETVEALEFPGLLRLVADGAGTDVGREKILSLTPSSDSEEIAMAVARGTEVVRLLEDGPLVPTLEDPLAHMIDDFVGRRTIIDGRHLVRVREFLAISLAARQRIEKADPATTALAELSDPLPDLTALAKRLTDCLDARGQIRDGASPLLASLRRQGQKVRQKTYSVLEKYARNHGEELAEDTIPYHDDRLVVLMRSGSKGRLSGLVHGRSGSGQSFYFEPLEVVDANNELRAVRDEESAERRRILNELIDATVSDLEELRGHMEFVAELDLHQAAARWAKRSQGIWPTIERGGTYRLESARHPLLDPALADLRERALGQAGHGGELVPLSMELSETERVLVITGPNAGGKTVALKTLGLLALAAHCGLPVPVTGGTRLPLLDRVVASVGDEQDLLADRSTFSGRLLRLKEAWEWAGPATLVLLDELGSGTDPDEGAALGIGLVEGLVEKGALAAISSHLTRLAAAALDLDGAFCAAMAFDTESGRPTYQLLPGTPGGSEAIALARRLGLPDEWIDRAEEMLGAEHGRLQRLLAEVETVRDELAGELGRTQSENRRLEAEVEASVVAREELEVARNKAGKEAQRAVGEFRRTVRKRLGREVERLKGELESGRRRGLEAAAIERIFRDSPAPEPERSSIPVTVGIRVRHRGLGWEGTVEKLARNRAEVAVKGKRVLCSVDELDGLEAEARSPQGGRPIRAVSTPVLDELPGKEIQLRGERVEAALEMLETYLDRVLLAGMAEVRVVHGHGTGRLKQAVRELLEHHAAVGKWRPGGRGEGGDGATVVSLSG